MSNSEIKYSFLSDDMKSSLYSFIESILNESGIDVHNLSTSTDFKWAPIDIDGSASNSNAFSLASPTVSTSLSSNTTATDKLTPSSLYKQSWTNMHTLRASTFVHQHPTSKAILDCIHKTTKKNLNDLPESSWKQLQQHVSDTTQQWRSTITPSTEVYPPIDPSLPLEDQVNLQIERYPELASLRMAPARLTDLADTLIAQSQDEVSTLGVSAVDRVVLAQVGHQVSAALQDAITHYAQAIANKIDTRINELNAGEVPPRPADVTKLTDMSQQWRELGVQISNEDISINTLVDAIIGTAIFRDILPISSSSRTSTSTSTSVSPSPALTSWLQGIGNSLSKSLLPLHNADGSQSIEQLTVMQSATDDVGTVNASLPEVIAIHHKAIQSGLSKIGIHQISTSGKVEMENDEIEIEQESFREKEDQERDSDRGYTPIERSYVPIDRSDREHTPIERSYVPIDRSDREHTPIDRGYERDRNRDRSRSRSRDRLRDRDRSRSRSIDRRDRTRDRNIDRSRERSRYHRDYRYNEDSRDDGSDYDRRGYRSQSHSTSSRNRSSSPMYHDNHSRDEFYSHSRGTETAVNQKPKDGEPSSQVWNRSSPSSSSAAPPQPAETSSTVTQAAPISGQASVLSMLQQLRSHL